MSKRYRLFLPPAEFDRVGDAIGQESTRVILDEDTKEQFQAKVVLSDKPGEGYDEAMIASERGTLKTGQWFVRIIERVEAEEAEVTVFESAKLSDRRGYMLRSMMAEDKSKLKRETMSSELEKRLKRKEQVVKELLDKEKKE